MTADSPAPEAQRWVYFVSDGTGITVERMSQSLLTQFSDVSFQFKKVPYINTVEKASQLAAEINQIAQHHLHRPIVMSTLVDPTIRGVIHKAQALVLDFFEAYIHPLEKELGARSDHTMGRFHKVVDYQLYEARMEAINYTLKTDDGLYADHYQKADVIIVGVSRCGKTPTCLYLAIQYGIRAANYPLLIEDLAQDGLPPTLQPFRQKLYGLSIDPKRLQTIRFKRRPNSQYAALATCIDETKRSERLFMTEKIPFMYSTMHSIEEIAAHIIADKKLDKI
jgi:regulator of PEP synthase PpsR (kinase-PPPase family)